MKCRNQTKNDSGVGRGPSGGMPYMYTYSATHGIFTFRVLYFVYGHGCLSNNTSYYRNMSKVT